jgi:hypothetical protein
MVIIKFQQLRKEDSQQLQRCSPMADIPPFKRKKENDQNNDDLQDPTLKGEKEEDLNHKLKGDKRHSLMEKNDFIGGAILADIPPFKKKNENDNNDDLVQNSQLNDDKKHFLMEMNDFIGGPVRVATYSEKWSKVRAKLNGHLLTIKCSKFQRLVYLLKVALKIKPKTFVY